MEELVAALAPRPYVKAGVRKLPARARDKAAGPLERSRANDGASAPQPELVARSRAPETLSRSDVVAPLAPERFRVQFTASREQVDKLRHLQDLLGHQVG